MKKIGLFWLLAANLFAAPQKVVIIRHAEMAGEGLVLTTKGQERAMAFVPYLMETFGSFAKLFAKKPDAAAPSLREIQTLTPLSEELKLPISATFASSDVVKQATAILQDKTLDGKIVLICWQHTTIADMAEAFGIEPKPAAYPDGRFDLNWIIDFTSGKPLLTVVNQKLLYGDSDLAFNPINSK